MCTDTYTAGIVVKELGLLEKRLPKDGKYKGVKFEVTLERLRVGRADHQPDARQPAAASA